jgi:two-component system, sensor histidine kinase
MGKFDQRKFQRTYENIATGIALTGPDCRFVKCNAAYSALTGYSQDEAAQDAPLFMIYPQDLDEFRRRIDVVLEGQESRFEIRNRYQAKSGGIVWVRNFVSTVRDAKGRRARILALVTNITSLMRVQQLQATEATLRLIIDKAPGLVAMFDRDIRYAA